MITYTNKVVNGGTNAAGRGRAVDFNEIKTEHNALETRVDNFYGAVTEVEQDDNYAIPDFTTEEKAIEGFTKVYLITGDTVNDLSVPGDWLSGNGVVLDNNKINRAICSMVAGKVVYSVLLEDLPAPPFVNTKSLSVGAIDQIVETNVKPSLLFFSDGSVDLDHSVFVSVKCSAFTALQYIVVCGRAVDTAGCYILAVDITTGKLVVAMTAYDNPAAYIREKSNVGLSLNTWHRIGYTYNGATKAIVLYVDGIAVAKTFDSGDTYSRLYAAADGSTSGNRLMIGGLMNTGNEGPALYSKIDNVLIINKKLSPTEVSEDNIAFEDQTDPIDLSFYDTNVAFDARFENNLLDDGPNEYDMSADSAPTYSSDHP